MKKSPINNQFNFKSQWLESNIVLAADIEKDKHLELKVQPHNFCNSGNGLCFYYHKYYLTSPDNLKEPCGEWGNLGFLLKLNKKQASKEVV